MADPRVLLNTQLDAFDIASISEVERAQFDEHEPLVLEGLRLDDSAAQHLSGVPLQVSGCVVENCDLSVFEFHGVRDTLFLGCKLRGTRFATFVRDVVFDRSQLTECRFRMAMLQRVVFERSHLVGCVGFDRCALNDVDLTQATDLLIGDPRTLRGAALCETQVPLIAARLAELSGIEVRDC
jgi:uncharacterized protein YjbI with pentapeptide repeats